MAVGAALDAHAAPNGWSLRLSRVLFLNINRHIIQLQHSFYLFGVEGGVRVSARVLHGCQR